VVDVEHVAVGGAAAVLDQQRDRPVEGDQRQGRVDTPLPPLGGLAEKLVAAGGAADHHRVPVRGLEEHVHCVRLHLAVFPTHDGGERDGHASAGARGGAIRLGVADDHVFGVEHAGHTVQCGQLFARDGPAHDQCPAQPRQVEGVHRLAELQHEVVGDVNGQADRADARDRQPLAHELRRRSLGVDAAHGPRREAVAAHRVLHDHRVCRLGRGTGRGSECRDRAGCARSAR
jgi:hypothetical protein